MATGVFMDEVERLVQSGLLHRFVIRQRGCWDHSTWEGFLREVYAAGHNLHPDIVGLHLEEEKKKYWENPDAYLEKYGKSFEKTVIEESAPTCVPSSPQPSPPSTQESTLTRSHPLLDLSSSSLSFTPSFENTTLSQKENLDPPHPPQAPIPEPPRPPLAPSLRSPSSDSLARIDRIAQEISLAEEKFHEKLRADEEFEQFHVLNPQEKHALLRELVHHAMQLPSTKLTEEQIVKGIQREINYIKFLYKTRKKG